MSGVICQSKSEYRIWPMLIRVGAEEIRDLRAGEFKSWSAAQEGYQADDEPSDGNTPAFRRSRTRDCLHAYNILHRLASSVRVFNATEAAEIYQAARTTDVPMPTWAAQICKRLESYK